jgi:hypothetical protein
MPEPAELAGIPHRVASRHPVDEGDTCGEFPSAIIKATSNSTAATMLPCRASTIALASLQVVRSRSRARRFAADRYGRVGPPLISG